MLFLAILPVTAAYNDIEILPGQIESGFMIGIMHVHHKNGVGMDRNLATYIHFSP
jgi:hypothetical protein